MGFERNERLRGITSLDLKVRSTLSIPTVTDEDFDGGVELGCVGLGVGLQQRQSSHGSKEISVAQSQARIGNR